jgi:hypothetical protein
MRFVIFFSALYFFLNGPADALCLDGRKPTVLNEYNDAVFVGVGIVASKRDLASDDDPEGVSKTIYTVNVEKVFKGKSRKLVYVASENTSSRFPMEVGIKYLIFLRSADGELFVDSCGNSGVLDQRADEVALLKGVVSNRRALRL